LIYILTHYLAPEITLYSYMCRVLEHVVNLQEKGHKQKVFSYEFCMGMDHGHHGELHEEDRHVGPQSGYVPIGTGPRADRHGPTSARFSPSSLHIKAHMISRIFHDVHSPRTDSKQL